MSTVDRYLAAAERNLDKDDAVGAGWDLLAAVRLHIAEQQPTEQQPTVPAATVGESEVEALAEQQIGALIRALSIHGNRVDNARRVQAALDRGEIPGWVHGVASESEHAALRAMYATPPAAQEDAGEVERLARVLDEAYHANSERTVEGLTSGMARAVLAALPSLGYSRTPGVGKDEVVVKRADVMDLLYNNSDPDEARSGALGLRVRAALDARSES